MNTNLKSSPKLRNGLLATCVAVSALALTVSAHAGPRLGGFGGMGGRTGLMMIHNNSGAAARLFSPRMGVRFVVRDDWSFGRTQSYGVSTKPVITEVRPEQPTSASSSGNVIMQVNPLPPPSGVSTKPVILEITPQQPQSTGVQHVITDPVRGLSDRAEKAPSTSDHGVITDPELQSHGASTKPVILEITPLQPQSTSVQHVITDPVRRPSDRAVKAPSSSEKSGNVIMQVNPLQQQSADAGEHGVITDPELQSHGASTKPVILEITPLQPQSTSVQHVITDPVRGRSDPAEKAPSASEKSGNVIMQVNPLQQQSAGAGEHGVITDAELQSHGVSTKPVILEITPQQPQSTGVQHVITDPVRGLSDRADKETSSSFIRHP